MKIPKIPPPKEMMSQCTDEGRCAARKAAGWIHTAFVWDNTVEGGDFWAGVFKRLKQIAEDGRLR